MSATSAVLQGRAAMRRLMSDTCTISRGGSAEPTYDETLREMVAAAGTAVYAGPCRVKARPTEDRVVELGETTVSLRSYVVSLPIDATGIKVDDVVVVTSSALDGDLVDKQMRVLDVQAGSHVTARRLICEEVLG